MSTKGTPRVPDGQTNAKLSLQLRKQRRTNQATQNENSTNEPPTQHTDLFNIKRPGGMREAVRRPTRDGVLDKSLDLLAPGP